MVVGAAAVAGVRVSIRLMAEMVALGVHMAGLEEEAEEHSLEELPWVALAELVVEDTRSSLNGERMI